MLKIVVLVSGKGTNLQALFNAQKKHILRNGIIVHVISNNPSAYALRRAKNEGVPASVAKTEDEILKIVHQTGAGIIALAGFNKILSPEFLAKCNAAIVNIHPSLIPSFCGRGMYGLKVHEAALKYGVKVSGATVHLVNEVPDGGKILAQLAVKIMDDDTPETLQARILEEAEHVIYPRTIEKLCQSKLMFKNKLKYPGRGIVTGMSAGGCPMFAYFITGRSENSRSRRFVRAENDGIDIEITKPHEGVDTSLILYSPVKTFGQNIIISNGDQTDIIYNTLKDGGTFFSALRECTYEPDAPHFTPRISAMLTPTFYLLNILRRFGKYQGGSTPFYQGDYKKGVGRIIYTYNKDVAASRPLPSFEGDPRPVNISENIGEFANNLWNELDDDNKVALYVRYYAPDFSSYTDRLFNKCEQQGANS